MLVVRLSLVATIFFATLFVAQPARPGGQSATSGPQNSPQALTLLQQSLAALTGGKSISDVTLSGTARRIAGSDDESGTVTIQTVSGSSKISLTLPSGAQSETHTTSNFAPAGTWSGPDGIAHAIPQHNLHSDPGWFPLFTLENFSSSTTAVLTYVGPETKNGTSVIHIQAAQPEPPNIDASAAKLYPHLTQMDIFLDATTLLPVAIDFNTHPDNNALLDLPVELLFSDYQIVGGAKIPMRVQKFLNNSLLLDLQFQSATLNSGLTAAQVGAL